MSGLTLPELSKKMKDLDIAILSTSTAQGGLSGRPMSNNGDVEYDGASFYFSWDRSRKIDEIKASPKVALFFQGNKGLFGKPPLSIAVEGVAELIYDKSAFEQHWTPDLERWFDQGVDTPGMVMIKVRASRIEYWDGDDQGEVIL